MNGKVIIAFVLGIIVTAVIILPRANQNEQTVTPTTAEVAITATTTQPPTEPVKALKYEDTAKVEEIKETPVEQTVESSEEEITAEQTDENSEEEIVAEVTPEPTLAPSPEPQKQERPAQVEVTSVTEKVSSASVKVSEYPKFFYENGQKYAYNTAYAEEMGQKTLIADDSEPNVIQTETYDWGNDPAGKVPGNFN